MTKPYYKLNLLTQMNQDLTLEESHALLSPLLNQPVQQARIGHGSFVTLEFGAIQQYHARTGNSKYEWFIWLYQCKWQLERSGAFVTGFEDEREVMEQIQSLNGKILTTLTISPLMDLLLEFQEGYTLRVFHHAEGDNDHWLIYTPDEFVLTAQGNRLRWEPSWLPF
jgi:hypothetical protein